MDDRMFRSVMGKFATGVTVLTTKADGAVHGMTANAFMSVSLNPKLIMISVGEKARMLQKIKTSNSFVVNILAEQQESVSRLFAGQSDEKRELEFDWIDEQPLIKDAIASVVCEVYNSQVVGDHTVFIGEVKDVVLKEGKPLVFYSGKYGSYVEGTSI
jgi:flavin reductase (DIM6/NTAB) family NADH-FMN oxidoreductase RutF